ncbi:transporter substrate-binding domain-containing protein [Guyparkeria sp. 1SP6A2]|nr:transporter substrate-binding domain-containing protein [Guyparkeria sp. 1SP6A2]
MLPVFRSLLPMIAALLLAGPAQADTSPGPDGRLTILTEDYPPLNYREDGQITGQATATVRAMADAVGESPTYELTSWDAGYRAATSGPNTALYSTVMTEQRKDDLQWVGPMGALDTSLYALSDAAVTVNNLADAREADGIATVKGYYSEEMLKEKGFTNLVGHDSERAALQSLLDGETALLVSSNAALPRLLEAAQADSGTIEPHFTLSTDLTYLAFSPDVADERVARWQAALDAMKDDGHFHAIYRQWLPNSTPPGILQLLTEDYPPLTYRENGKATGYVTDVVREITERLDIDAPIRLTTWENAYRMATIHPDVVLFSAERTPEREDLFHWVGPVGSNKAILYAKVGTDLSLDDLDDAHEVDSIATTSNWFTEQYLRDEGFTNLKSQPEPVDAVRAVMDDEAALTILTDSTAPEIVEQAGYRMADLQPLLTVLTTDYYIAISKDTPESTVRQWREALDAIRDDGRLETIRQRYFPKQQETSAPPDS